MRGTVLRDGACPGCPDPPPDKSGVWVIYLDADPTRPRCLRCAFDWSHHHGPYGPHGTMTLWRRIKGDRT